MGVNVAMVLREMTLDDLYNAILYGEFANGIVFKYVLGYDDYQYKRALADDRVLSEVAEELKLMNTRDYIRMVEALELPIVLEV